MRHTKKFGLLLCASLLIFDTVGIFAAAAETRTVQFVITGPIPSSITIAPGDSVQFVGVSTSHPIRQAAGPDTDAEVSGGFSSTTPGFTHTFNTPGTFYYLCTNHGVNGGAMRGAVVVQVGGGPTATPTTEPTAGPQPTAVPTNTIPEGCTTKPDSTVLLLPANAASISKTKVTLDWEDNACANSYRVLVKSGKKNGTTADQKTVSKSTYKTIKLSKGKTYFWSVKSCNSLGCSNSPARSFSIK